MKHIYPKQFYSKNLLNDRVYFFDYPYCSIQNLIGTSTCKILNDKFNHTDYPNDRYTYIKKIEDGSASKLYIGYDNKLKKNIIIKKISKNESWKDELKILKYVSNNDKLLQFIDFYESFRFAYIITEYYNYPNLFVYGYENVPYSENKAKEIILKMCNCVKQCHDNNVVHLDIKFENFIVLSDKYILIDFGHSEHINKFEIKNDISSYGTLYYLCPEGYDGIYSLKSDIWSIGICYYLLLTGEYPFAGISDRRYSKNVKKNKLYIQKSISDNARNIITQCLSYNLKNRPFIENLIEMLTSA